MKKSLFTYPHIPNQHFLVHPFGNMRASKSFLYGWAIPWTEANMFKFLFG